MAILMRIIQRFDACRDDEFVQLERMFAELERRRPDYPNGRRLRPISGTEPCNTLIWECEFQSLDAAHKALDFFHGDAEHESLFERQGPFIEQVRIEFYSVLDF